MKKSFFGGILFLTLLGIGRGVYAALNSPLSHLKSSSNSNKLTAQNWDALVAEVENLKAFLPSSKKAPLTLQASIPDGAVMAFDLNQCPEGWVVYTGAKGKFIMGAEYNSDLKTIGGNASIKLTVGQLPPHSHDISIGGRGTEGGDDSWNVGSVGGATTHRRSIKKRLTGKTDSVGNGEAINILNPHIKLIYCKKGGEGARSLGNKPAPVQRQIAECMQKKFPSCRKGEVKIGSEHTEVKSYPGISNKYTCVNTRICETPDDSKNCQYGYNVPNPNGCLLLNSDLI